MHPTRLRGPAPIGNPYGRSFFGWNRLQGRPLGFRTRRSTLSLPLRAPVHWDLHHMFDAKMSTPLTVSSLVCAMALVWLCLSARLLDLALIAA